MDYMSLWEIQYTFECGISEMAPDYLQFLQWIKKKEKKKKCPKQDNGYEGTNIKG